MPRALERHEVKDLVHAWGQAARRAQEAGFDMLELHGAHGYLVHEFLSERSTSTPTNMAVAELNRMRFITEVTEAVRTHWPDQKPLFARLSVEDNAGWGPEQSARLAKILKPKGVDVIDCSSGGITDAAPILGKEIKYSYQVPLSEYVRREADIMTMAVGLIIHGDQAEQILQDGQADLIAVGREILNNPNWPMDAALKLGIERPFRNVPRNSAGGWAPVPSAVSAPSRRPGKSASKIPERCLCILFAGFQAKGGTLKHRPVAGEN